MENKELNYKVKVIVTRQLFFNEETNFGIFGCVPKEIIEGKFAINAFGNITVKGIMPKLELEKEYTIICKPVEDKNYGMQYEFVNLETNRPRTSDEQKQFLASLLTEKQVEEIMKVYELPVDEIINDTFDVTKVKGFGENNYPRIKDKVVENFVMFDIISELGKYGITYNQIKKIHEKYKSAELALEKINKNPYILYYDIDGVGFKKADKIAQQMGIVKKDDDRRVEACIVYVLEENQNEGNTWLTLKSLKSKVAELINNSKYDIDSIIKDSSKIYFDGSRVAFQKTYDVEKDICEELLRIKKTIKTDVDWGEVNQKDNKDKPKTKEERIAEFNIDAFLEKQEEQQGFKYTKKQRSLFYTVLNNGANGLIGSAGTGKTSLLVGLLNMFDEMRLSYLLCSPSAKASMVMTEYTGRKAFTIHRALGWTPKGFVFNEGCPLFQDVIIVDEVSMVDIWLFKSLLRAVKDGAIVVLCGDPAQLESVQAGNILFDIIESKQFNICYLDKVFRQALDSGIITVATDTRNGVKFIKGNERGAITIGNKKDTHIWFTNKEQSRNKIIKSYTAFVEKYGVDNVVVLSPTKKGNAGSYSINKDLQEIVNPASSTKAEIQHKDVVFREGDKVIHVKNNYNASWLNQKLMPHEKSETGIFNGESGVIMKIINKHVYVDFGDKVIAYSLSELQQLEHAWCLTVHKYQGSSCDVVILTMDSRHYYSAKRSLLYTGITRAKKILAMIVDPKVIVRAITNNVVVQKQTFLQEFLVAEQA